MPATPPPRPYGVRLSDLLRDVPPALLGPPDPVPPIANAQTPPGADEAELGRLAMLLLDALGSALVIIPRDRPRDTRQLMRLLLGLGGTRAPDPRLPSSRPLWGALLALPDDQLDDVVARARIGAALLDDDPPPSYPY